MKNILTNGQWLSPSIADEPIFDDDLDLYTHYEHHSKLYQFIYGVHFSAETTCIPRKVLSISLKLFYYSCSFIYTYPYYIFDNVRVIYFKVWKKWSHFYMDSFPTISDFDVDMNIKRHAKIFQSIDLIYRSVML